MSYLQAVNAGLLLGLFLAISVGPTLFAVIQHSLQHNFRAGIAFIIGVSFSDALYVNMANLATEWLDFLEGHKRTVGLVGSLLFMAMGLYGLIKKYKPKRPKRAKDIVISKGMYFKIFMSGFLMNTLNPAVIIIWMGAAISVKMEPLSTRFVLFTTCLGIILIFDILKVFLAEKIRKWLTIRKIMYLNKVSAVFILIFGCILFYKVYTGMDLGGH